MTDAGLFVLGVLLGIALLLSGRLIDAALREVAGALRTRGPVVHIHVTAVDVDTADDVADGDEWKRGHA